MHYSWWCSALLPNQTAGLNCFCQLSPAVWLDLKVYRLSWQNVLGIIHYNVHSKPCYWKDLRSLCYCRLHHRFVLIWHPLSIHAASHLGHKDSSPCASILFHGYFKRNLPWPKLTFYEYLSKMYGDQYSNTVAVH